MRTFILGGLVLVSAGAAAAPEGRDINPGVLGANALPPYDADGPWVDDRWLIEVGAAGQLSTPKGGGEDRSFITPFRTAFPFGKRAVMIGNGEPFELYAYSPQTIAAWQPKQEKGIARADVTAGARFLVVDGHDRFPSVGLRLLFRTATGEDRFTRRFLDAPAYEFDLLLGQRFNFTAGQLELVINFGFFGWQQAGAGQNDAYAWSARAGWKTDVLRLYVETRGYRGWIHDDTPIVLAASFGIPLGEHVELIAGGSRSFQDPPGWDARIGLRFTGLISTLTNFINPKEPDAQR